MFGTCSRPSGIWRGSKRRLASCQTSFSWATAGFATTRSSKKSLNEKWSGRRAPGIPFRSSKSVISFCLARRFAETCLNQSCIHSVRRARTYFIGEFGKTNIPVLGNDTPLLNSQKAISFKGSTRGPAERLRIWWGSVNQSALGTPLRLHRVVETAFRFIHIRDIMATSFWSLRIWPL